VYGLRQFLEESSGIFCPKCFVTLVSKPVWLQRFGMASYSSATDKTQTRNSELTCGQSVINQKV
jgi:hypothetical protein